MKPSSSHRPPARASSSRPVARRRPAGLRSALWLLLAATAFTGCDSRERDEPAAAAVKLDENRSAGEEGKMGKPSSTSKQGLYAMRGPKDAPADDAGAAAPEMAEEAEAPRREMDMEKRSGASKSRRELKPSPAPSVAVDKPPTPPPGDASGEGYEKVAENQFLKTGDEPLSTFSIKVDA